MGSYLRGDCRFQRYALLQVRLRSEPLYLLKILSVRPCWKVPLGPIVSGMMAFLLREWVYILWVVPTVRQVLLHSIILIHQFQMLGHRNVLVFLP